MIKDRRVAPNPSALSIRAMHFTSSVCGRVFIKNYIELLTATVLKFTEGTCFFHESD